MEEVTFYPHLVSLRMNAEVDREKHFGLREPLFSLTLTLLGFALSVKPSLGAICALNVPFVKGKLMGVESKHSVIHGTVLQYGFRDKQSSIKVL